MTASLDGDGDVAVWPVCYQSQRLPTGWCLPLDVDVRADVKRNHLRSETAPFMVSPRALSGFSQAVSHHRGVCVCVVFTVVSQAVFLPHSERGFFKSLHLFLALSFLHHLLQHITHFASIFSSVRICCPIILLLLVTPRYRMSLSWL